MPFSPRETYRGLCREPRSLSLTKQKTIARQTEKQSDKRSKKAHQKVTGSSAAGDANDHATEKNSSFLVIYLVPVRHNRVAVTFLVHSPAHSTPQQEKEVLQQAVRDFRLVGVQGRQSTVQPAHDATHDTSDTVERVSSCGRQIQTAAVEGRKQYITRKVVSPPLIGRNHRCTRQGCEKYNIR